MRPLHRWPSFLFLIQILFLQYNRTIASGTITATIWEWSGTVCCDSDKCDPNCNYNFKVCIGVPLSGECQFAENTFEIPHTVPDMYGSYLSNTNTVVQRIPVQLNRSLENVVLTMNVTVPGQPNFIVFFKQKTLSLKKDKKHRFDERNLSHAKVDIELNLTCDENFYGEDCTLFCEPPKNGSHYTCTDYGPKCDPGWKGPACDKPICDEIGGCGKGKCIAPNQCSCMNGWFGQKCDQCQPREGCVNGFCSKKPGTCLCKPNWGGENCDKIVDKCLENPCLNGGSCYSEALLDHYKCACVHGFTGKKCETAVMTMTVIQKEHTEIRISDNTGFWIFAVVTVIVIGIIIAWFITKRNSAKKAAAATMADGNRAGRRQSDIEMESFKDGTRIKHGINDKRINPPRYDVNELSAERLSTVSEPHPIPPPTYDEAIGKSSTILSSSSSSCRPSTLSSSRPSTTLPLRSSNNSTSISIPPDDEDNNHLQSFKCKIINEIEEDNERRRPPKN